MIVDGRSIAADIYRDIRTKVASLSRAPRLGIVTCAPNAETKQYLELKKRKSSDVGVNLVLLELDVSSSTVDMVTSIKRLAEEVDGLVVQLPLPSHIDREVVLQAIPEAKDPDGFNYPTFIDILPPVVGAIDEISTRHDIVWEGKQVAIFGHGRLVGKPAEAYAKSRGAMVSVITEHTADAEMYLKNADIIIAGAGVPQAITPDMVKSGVIIFDAGASEDGGVIVGDVSKDVAEKAALFTPVPGGIGPITVAVLLSNLVGCVRQ